MPKPKQPKGSNVQAILTPRESDILFGRGGHVNHHRANQYYLELVSDRKDEYQNCKKVDKASIAWDIIDELRDQKPPPRFLKKDYSTGLWHIVKDNEVRRKISQCLRERAAPVLPRKNKVKAKKIAKSTASKQQQRSSRGKNKGDLLAVAETQATLSESLPLDKKRKPTEPNENQMESLPVARLQVQVATPPPLRLQERQESFQEHRIETPIGRDNEEVVVGPPLPIPQPTRFGDSAKGWSDFLTGSFASFTPSIFDAGGTENAWENLLDPSSLPQLCDDDDDDSFPGSLTSEEGSVKCACTSKQTFSLSTIETLPASNCQQKRTSECECTPGGSGQSGTDPKEGLMIDPVFVDSFFSCDVMGLGKVLEHSRLLSSSSVLDGVV